MLDSIVALATPSGRSGIGVIRLSGADSLAIIRRLIREKGFNPQPRYAYLKNIFDLKSGEVLDETIITFFQSPKSFTGEDVFEISCHGSPVVQRQIIDFCLTLGVRFAQPGEFSLRALANGRINLAQAEAIRDLIDSQTLAAVKQSVKQLQGEVSNQLQPIKDELLEVIVLLESTLEFVEDDLPDLQLADISTKLFSVSQKINQFASTFQSGKLLREGLAVAIVGRPNVGKSSLFNALLGQERAIVTDIAGTTRDQLYESIVIHGIPVSLIDTAGLRDTDDVVESIGVKRSRQSIADADLVIILLDGSEPFTDDDMDLIRQVSELNYLIVINKSDLELVATNHNLENSIKISAKTGDGIEYLLKNIVKRFIHFEDNMSGFMISDIRHFDLLNKSKDEIDSSLLLLHQKQSEEIILIGLHNALRYLGQITGETTTEDMLTQIFSTFCIGK